MNGFPTMYNFHCKCLSLFGFCALCDKCMETTTHAFIYCAHARKTWALWQDCPLDITAAELDILDIVS